jgi:hypothetical protein
MKIKLNEPVRIDGEFHGNGEVVDVSDNMYNILKKGNIKIEDVKEEPKLKPKEKNKDVNED